MISEKTVLVLGAGASAPYGFPTGEGLRERILGYDKNELEHFLEIVASDEFTSPDCVQFQRAFGRSPWLSIDRFLQESPHFAGLGKLLIAYVLMPCENRNSLQTTTNGRWYPYFYNQVLAPRDPDEFAANDLSIITYNYDRSLDQYLLDALRYGFDLTPDGALEALSTLPIVHVHGQLGSLPVGGTADESQREYREDLIGLKYAPKWLSIISDEDRLSIALRECHQLLNGAIRVIFLGFGYDQVNIDRLELQEHCPHAHITGTTYTLTNSEIINGITPRFRGLASLEFGDTRHDCLSFLQNYRELFI